MIYIIGGIFLMILASKKKSGDKFTYTVDNNAFTQAFLAWVSAKEGHRPDVSSNAGNASAQKAPCTIVYNGKEYKNPVSVGGILWTTFVNNAKIYKYDPTCENFASLTKHQDSPIWLVNVDHFRKKGLVFTKDPIMSAYIGFWYWGGWDQDIVSTQDVKDVLNSDDNPRIVLRRLVDLRIYYFTELGRLKPTYKADGSVEEWIEQANKYFTMASPFYNV